MNVPFRTKRRKAPRQLLCPPHFSTHTSAQGDHACPKQSSSTRSARRSVVPSRALSASSARRRRAPTWSTTARAQPRGRPRPDRGPLLWLRHSAGPAGLQHRPHRSLLSEKLPQTVNGFTCPATAPRASTRSAPPPTRSGRPGRRLHRRRRRVGEPLQRAHQPAGAADQNENLQRQRRPAQRLHRDGPDRGQRRQQVRGRPRRHGQVRAALSGTGPRNPRKTGSSTARSSR